jgi:hypothetical protein
MHISAPYQAQVLLTILERYRDRLPFAEEELTRHYAILSTLSEQQHRGDQALADWRAALSRRWHREIEAQRLYVRIHKAIRDTPLLRQFSAENQEGYIGSAQDLLSRLQQLSAALALLPAPTPIDPTTLHAMDTAAANLAAAIAETDQHEDRRRTALSEQRMTLHLYERTCIHTRDQIAHYLGDIPEMLSYAA